MLSLFQLQTFIVAVLLALEYSKMLSSDVRAVSIAISEDKKKRFLDRWERFSDITSGVQLNIVDYEYRNIHPTIG